MFNYNNFDLAIIKQENISFVQKEINNMKQQLGINFLVHIYPQFNK